MCYSALIRADYAKLVREFGAILSLEEFAELYAHDPGKKRPKTPKAMDDGFAGARTEQGRDIVAKIQQWHAQERQNLEAELARQRERRDIAHATLATRPTQKARNDLRVAGNRIERAQARLEDLHRVQLLPRDNRIFPGTYAPVMVSESGRRVIKPMRYQCRLPDKPARNDVLYPGTYNARRDSLEAIGAARSAFATALSWCRRSMSTYHATRSQGARLAPVKRNRMWCWSFAPTRPATCFWPAFGRNGRDRKDACSHSPRSPTPRHAMSPRQVTIAA